VHRRRSEAVTGGPYAGSMDGIVDLLARRRTPPGSLEAEGDGSDRSAVVLSFPAPQPARPDDPESMARLERAIDRLHDIVSRALLARGRVEPRVETEMLAILGELAMDCVDDAAARAERLAQGLARAGR
jgi:hypothetical protein